MNDDLQQDIWSHIETPKPAQRVVMLGASNLSRAFPIAVSMSQKLFGVPLDIHVAKGHGRSYGKESSCLGKKISGIFSCGIWHALELENSMPTSAFITDIGNDLAYEQPVETIIEWVSACIDRLLSIDAKVVLTGVPIDVLKRLSVTRYRLMRTLFFPQCRLNLHEMLRRAEQLNERLHALAENTKTSIFTAPNKWYGFDPIHPKRRHLTELWSQLLTLNTSTPFSIESTRCPLALTYYLRALQPETWTYFSISRRASQPHGRLSNGTRIFLY